MKSRENLIGAYTVIIGVSISLFLGILLSINLNAQQDWVYFLLMFIGVIVGFVGTGKDPEDNRTFLIAAVSLVIVSGLGQQTISIGNIGLKFNIILDTLLIMLIPATIIVALKSVFSIASLK